MLFELGVKQSNRKNSYFDFPNDEKKGGGCNFGYSDF